MLKRELFLRHCDGLHKPVQSTLSKRINENPGKINNKKTFDELTYNMVVVIYRILSYTAFRGYQNIDFMLFILICVENNTMLYIVFYLSVSENWFLSSGYESVSKSYGK